VKDDLFVHRCEPNQVAMKEYLVNTYGPQVEKSFTGAMEAFIYQQLPQLTGDLARTAIVKAIVEIVHKYFPETSNLRSGQTTWISVAKDEVASYGKSIAKTRMVPTILTIIAPDEAAQRRDGKSIREIKKDAVARLCLETDAQGGCITAAEIAILLKTTPNTVSKYIAEWQTEHNQLLPRRGTIHDMGPTLTHKKEICRLLFLEGKTVCETVNLTNHSTKAIDRYITNFRQVFTCQTKGLTTQETALATNLSPNLVEEYKQLFKEYAVTDSHFHTLLNHP
jgi:hypothetical protein